MEQEQQEAAKEEDYQRFLFEELEQANLETLDQVALEESFEQLNNVEVIRDALGEVHQTLTSEEAGSLDTINRARQLLLKLKSFGSVYEHLWERLNSMFIELEDVSQEVESLADSIEMDPEGLISVQQKLEDLYRLQKKHGVQSVEELLQIQNDLDQRIGKQHDLEAQIESLQKRSCSLKKP